MPAQKRPSSPAGEDAGEPLPTRRRLGAGSSIHDEDLPAHETENLPQGSEQESMTPEEELSLEHFNIPSRERREIAARLGIALRRETVPAPFWAFLQTCNIDCLKQMLGTAEAASYYVNWFIDYGGSKEKLKAWKQQLPLSRGPSETPAGTPHGTPQRETEPKNLAKERDNYQCVLTHLMPFDVAHIYPHCLIHPTPAPAPTVPVFWQFLSAFWKPDQIEKWRSQIFRDSDNPATAADACFNLICMQPTIHRLWSDAKFALRPLEYNDDKSELDVEFHWQPTPRHSIDDEVPINQLPETSRGLRSSTYRNGNPCRLHDSFVTGHVFKLKTPDPNRLPLPSKELLELQWHLQRALAMSGGGEAEEEDYDDDEADVEGDYPADALHKPTNSASDSSSVWSSEREDV